MAGYLQFDNAPNSPPAMPLLATLSARVFPDSAPVRKNLRAPPHAPPNASSPTRATPFLFPSPLPRPSRIWYTSILSAMAEAAAPKSYSLDAVKKPLKRARVNRPSKLRASITPGTVLIILAGRDKGRRVVFLKQLESGLLLVTGPFKVNRIPLRRVNQRYVIATSTKVDVSGVDVAKFDDSYFAGEQKKKEKKSEGEFFETEKKEKKVVSQARKDDQAAVDEKILAAVGSEPLLKEYLSARFSLTSGDKPHRMQF
ncbi:unnamed protein product [Closterium sp. Naga37s-1]|nr:unnamed protein product [Closterium sp. Naga37s-1]